MPRAAPTTLPAPVYRSGVRSFSLGLACLSLVACSSFGSDVAPSAGSDASVADGGTTTPEAGRTDPDGGGTTDESYAAAVLADTPIAYYRFEDPNEPFRNEVVGSTAVALYASPGNAPATTGEGIASRHLALNMTRDDDRVQFSSVTDSGKPFTIEAWVLVDGAVDTQRGLFSNMENANDEVLRRGHWLYLEPVPAGTGGLVRSECWANGTTYQFSLSMTAAPVSAWFHLAYSVADNGRTRTYLNGIESANTDPATAPAPASTQPLAWGGFHGRIDELAFYDHVVPGARIAVHINSR